MYNPTSHPLFQLVDRSPQNNVMFFTPYSEDEAEMQKAQQLQYCCVCGHRATMLIPVNPRQTLSKCHGCYDTKQKWDMQVAQRRLPFELSEAIWTTKTVTSES